MSPLGGNKEHSTAIAKKREQKMELGAKGQEARSPVWIDVVYTTGGRGPVR